MPKTKLQQIESSISSFEGFTVKLSSTNGKPKGLPAYEWARIARNSHTVGDYLRRRIEPYYHGVSATVLLADGRAAKPAMPLEKVRASYLDAPGR